VEGKDKILDKIRKLLALGKDAGATEHERTAAMRQAHKMLIKHNIELAEAEASGQKTEQRTVKRDVYYGRPWARVVSHAMADLFFCEYVYYASGKAKNTIHCFVGRESNATTACEMARWLVESILKEAKRRQRDEDEGNAYFRSFATAASVAIWHRVERMVAEASKTDEPDSKPGTALVVANAYVVEQAANEKLRAEIFGEQLRKGRSGKAELQYNGTRDGHEYGKNVSLNRQIESKEDGDDPLGMIASLKQIQRS
jgi:hypothetical protein